MENPGLVFIDNIYDLPRAERFSTYSSANCGRSSLCESNKGNLGRLMILYQKIKIKNTKGTNAKRIRNEARNCNEFLVA